MAQVLAFLKEDLRYDKDSGLFYWIKPAPKRTLTKPAGTLTSTGYIIIKYKYTKYFAHRLAWFYMTGEFPEDEIDHIDTDRKNNRWDNLRVATRTQNARNYKTKSNNTSGIKGVSRFRDKWRARCGENGKEKHIGIFKTLEEASIAFINYTKKFGEFNYKGN